MKTLRGIVRRVTRRKGIVGRGWLKQGTVRAVAPSAVRPIDGRTTPRFPSRLPTLMEKRMAINPGTRKRGGS